MLAYLLKKFYILCAVLVIALAVVVQSGRSLFPLLANYDRQLTAYLSEQLDLSVSVERLTADWQELKPSLTLYELSVSDQEGRPLLKADRVLLRLNLVSSALEGRLAWDKIVLRRPQLSLSQGTDGYWGLPDFVADQERPSADEPLAPDDLLTLFEVGTRVELLDASIDLSFASGHQQTFSAPYLLLEHEGDFHRLSLQVDLEGRDRALVAILEGRGDPRDPKNFQTEGYLNLRDFPTLEPLTAIGGILVGESKHRDWYREGRMNASLWFSSQEDGGGYDWVGNLGLDDVALPLEELTLDRVSATIGGEWRRSGRWRVALQDLSAEWRDRALEPLQVSVSTARTNAPIHWMVDHIDLRYWTTLADQLGLLGDGRLQEVVRTLNPQGDVRHLQLTVPQDDWRGWELMAELGDVAVEPWQGVPGLSGVTGFVEANQRGGHVDLDSRNGFEMFFAKTYDEPMAYQSARGQVAWHLRPEENQIYVNSGPLSLRGPGESATGSMWLSLPWERNTGDIDLYLDIHGEDLSANVYDKYLPKVVPASLTDWLTRSLGENNPGTARSAHFLFRGTLNRPGQPRMLSYQLALDMAGADLNYHPDWPALSDLTGQLVLDNNRVDARVEQARLYNSTLENARIQVAENPVGEGLLLNIDGQLQALASDGLQLLREGYLRRYVGDNMDAWSVQGTIDAELDLAIPLQPDQPGAAQQVAMDLTLPRLTMNDLNLSARDLSGPLRYDNEQGLSSEGLTGELFGEPLTLAIASRQEEDRSVTAIDLNGRASGAVLAEWTQRPALQFLDGAFAFDGELELSHYRDPQPDRDQQLAAFTLSSDLRGVSLNVPAPIGKTAEQTRELTASVILGRQSAQAELYYNDHLQARAQIDLEQQQLQRASVGLGVPAQLPEAPGLHLKGAMETLDLEGWQDLLRRYQDLVADDEQPTPETAFEGLPVEVDLALARYSLGPLELEEIELGAVSTERGWRLTFTNPELAGELDWEPGQPLALRLARVDLPRSVLESAVGATESADPFDPRNLPEAQVSIESLMLGGEDYGQWEFRLAPVDQGVIVDQLQGRIRGLTVTGQDEGTGGRLLWSQAADSPERTYLAASLRAGDLSEVMQRWGQSDILESESANYRLDVSWAGAPQAFDLQTLEGDVRFNVTSGRFKRNPAAGSDGILRLFAVLNFDSLARRLRLDFSDLYQSGLAYDSIEGLMTFDKGTLVFSEPVQVRSPSSRLQLAGRANLVDETLDTRLIATLPVAGNLTFLTAVAAGLPAAAGVFLVSKLFEKQVDQATSISYTIQGDWDDPTIKFDRMFEGGAGLTTENGSTEPQPPEEP